MKYVVQKGDTLYSIAKKYGTTVSRLIEENRLPSYALSIGQILILPSTSSYQVKKGDTLYSIARQFGISVSELMDLNHLTSTNIKIGQTLSLSKEKDTIPVGKSCFGEEYEATQYITYTVKKGDSLYSIGKKYEVSVDAIKRLNQLDTNLLQIGQILKIKEAS